jgi:hypothetical protein
MEAMDGPINFGERDTWWGLVTEGFHEPLYRMNFNAPYYRELFENYGFRVFEQICFGMDPKNRSVKTYGSVCDCRSRFCCVSGGPYQYP